MVMPQFSGIPGLPTGPQPFAVPQYSGGEGNYDAKIRKLLQAGVDPDTIRQLGPQIASGKVKLDDLVASLEQRVTGSGGGRGGRGGGTTAATPAPGTDGINTGGLFPRGQLLQGALATGASVLPGLGFATQELMEGRPLSAAVGGTAGVVTGGLVGAATQGLRNTTVRGVPGLALKGLGYALPALAGGAATGLGSVAEREKARRTGQEITGQEGSLAAQLGQAEKIAAAYGQIQAAGLAPYIQGQKDLGQHGVDMLVQATTRLQPLAEQAQRNAMIRQQQLMNTQAQNYAMLGTVATAGRLAQGAQAEAGANFRTALQANPYSNAVLQAPSISFG